MWLVLGSGILVYELQLKVLVQCKRYEKDKPVGLLFSIFNFIFYSTEANKWFGIGQKNGLEGTGVMSVKTVLLTIAVENTDFLKTEKEQ